MAQDLMFVSFEGIERDCKKTRINIQKVRKIDICKEGEESRESSPSLFFFYDQGTPDCISFEKEEHLEIALNRLKELGVLYEISFSI